MQKSHTQRQTRQNAETAIYGLKFIRMIIASYCIGVSIGLINGFDPNVFFKPFFTASVAEVLGSTIVFWCAVLLFLGMFLRLTSLYLAVVVLFSSVLTNFFADSGSSMDSFWRDLVIAAALLLNYWGLNERARNKHAIVQAYQTAHGVDPNVKVVPTRVRTEPNVKPQVRNVDPTVSQSTDVSKKAKAQAPEKTAPKLFSKFKTEKDISFDDEPKNIFV